MKPSHFAAVLGFAMICVGAYGVGMTSRKMVDSISYQDGYRDGITIAKSAVYASYDGDYERAASRAMSGSPDYVSGFSAGHQNGYGRGVQAARDAVDAVQAGLRVYERSVAR